MKPMTVSCGHGDDQVVAAILYTKVKQGIIPFSVFTVQPGGKPENNPSCYEWDVEWCKRDETAYYHNSGCGLQFYLHPYSNRKAGVPIWWNRELVHPTSGRSTRHIRLSNDTVRRWGMVILPKPAKILGGSCHPFDSSVKYSVTEGECEYCNVCDDFIPTDALCEHIDWCEECACYKGEGVNESERCKCQS